MSQSSSLRAAAAHSMGCFGSFDGSVRSSCLIEVPALQSCCCLLEWRSSGESPHAHCWGGCSAWVGGTEPHCTSTKSLLCLAMAARAPPALGLKTLTLVLGISSLSALKAPESWSGLRMTPVDTWGLAELCPGCTEPAVSFHLQPLKQSLGDDFTPEATQMHW